MDRVGTFPVRLIEKADTGSLEGYASVFDVVDSDREIVAHGAFSKTLRELRQSGRPLPLTKNHGVRAEDVIGSADSLKEDSHGLWARFRFSSDPEAQNLRTKAREGHLTGLSIFGAVVKSAEQVRDGLPVRVLKEIKLMAVGLTPFPANGMAMALAKAVTDRPWDGSAGRFTPEQWRRATLIDTGEGDADSKSRYKLPVREPDGTINRNGAHAAAAALAGGRGGVDASTEQKRSAARALVRIYRSDLDEDPPESLLRMAGMAVASLDFDEFTEAMGKALLIPHEAARKAAVHELLGCYEAEPAAGPDEPTADADVTEKETSTPPADDAAVYALTIAGETGPAGGKPSGGSLAESLTVPVDVAKTTSDLDLIEQQIKEVLGRE